MPLIGSRGGGSSRGFGQLLLRANDGLTAATAGLTGYQIKQDTGTTIDQLYWIKNPNINGGVATQIYCNMSTDGGGWMLVYELNNATRSATGTADFTFATDNSALFGSGYTAYSRVAYRMQNNMGNGGTSYYAWASMDKWTGLNPLTVRPATSSRVYQHQTNVTNLNVISNYNQSWVTNTTGSSGRVEIWEGNYGTARGIADGTGDVNTYDENDTYASALPNGYGCLQVFNMTTAGFTNAPQVVMAWNNHTNASTPDIGFGRNLSGNPFYASASTHPDWTFANNNAYSFKHQGWIR